MDDAMNDAKEPATKEDLRVLERALRQEMGGVRQETVEVKQDVSGLKQDVSELKKDVGGLKKDVNGLKQDVGGLKRDVSGLKQDVSGLKQDVSELKKDMGGLKQDVSELKQDMGAVKVNLHRLNVGFARHEERLVNMEAKLDDLLTLKVQFNGFASAMDRVVGFLEDFKLHMALQEDRISRLELRRS